MKTARCTAIDFRGALCVVFILGCDHAGKGSVTPPDLIRVASSSIESEGPLTGQSILLRSQQSYLDTKSYTGTVSFNARFNNGQTDMFAEGELRIVFLRPEMISIQGTCRPTEFFGYSFTIVGDSVSVWDAFSLEKKGSFQTQPTLRAAILKYQGASIDSVTTVPSLLSDMKWSRETIFLPQGRIFEAFSTSASLDGHEFIDGKRCYRIQCEREIATWTFWIDMDRLLLRQRKVSASPTQLAAQKKHGGGGKGCVALYDFTESHRIQDLDTQLDESLFSPTTK